MAAFGGCYRGKKKAGRRLTVRYLAVLKHQFARVTPTHPDLVKLLVSRKPSETTLDDERRYAL
jgi:hypothetical protein